jgi:hypothetical protein
MKEGGGFQTPIPPQKFGSFDKADPNFQFRGKYIRKYVEMGFTHFQIERDHWLVVYRPQIPVLSALRPPYTPLSVFDRNTVQFMACFTVANDRSVNVKCQRHCTHN